MKLKSFVLATACGLLLVVPAFAATVDGTIDPATDPTMPVVFISSPNCTGQGVSPVLYHSYPFTVAETGTYHLEVLSDAGFASVYVFSPTFDPTNGFPTCIAGDNSGNPVELDLLMSPGVQYFAVPFDDTFAQLGGNYTLSIFGPGTVFIEGDAQLLAIPTLSPLGLGALVLLFLVAGFVALRRRSSAG